MLMYLLYHKRSVIICYNFHMEQDITRERIIEYLKDFALPKDYVFAMWLEGADGLNEVDEYSDMALLNNYY